MKRDEFDAKCWRAFKKAISLQIEDRKMSRSARELAVEMMALLGAVEVATQEGRSPS